VSPSVLDFDILARGETLLLEAPEEHRQIEGNRRVFGVALAQNANNWPRLSLRAQTDRDRHGRASRKGE
jgi:hypothetical protein